MHIAEFTLHAKPGHFQDVADIYYASPSEPVELQLLHHYVKS